MPPSDIRLDQRSNVLLDAGRQAVCPAPTFHSLLVRKGRVERFADKYLLARLVINLADEANQLFYRELLTFIERSIVHYDVIV